MKKNATPPQPEIDVECVQVDDMLRWWDTRKQFWRIGKVSMITSKFFHVITSKKMRKIAKDDMLFLVRGRFDIEHKLVETPE